MDTGAKKILENVTIKTLHAHGFSRSSSQANLVLADVLSRYMSQLAVTVAKYAEHAGRRNIVAKDAVEAFGELGTSVDELKDYCATEAKDMARYAAHSSKRIEELSEFKAQLAIGLSRDESPIPLEWRPVPDHLPSDEEEEDSEEDEVETPSDDVARANVMMVDTDDMDAEGEDDVHVGEQPDLLPKEPLTRRRPTPPLPLSPISNPSTPPRKRARTANWQPPEHIPDFLPPFPTADSSQAPDSHTAGAAVVPDDPASNNGVKVERPATPPLQAQVSTASSSADYLTVIPYEQSSLASQPLRHLPPSAPPKDETSMSRTQLPLPQTQQTLLGAYHYMLTHPPPARPTSVNPGRYRVALALVNQSEKYNRWDAPTTLYGNTAPNPPRMAVMPPSYAVAIGKNSGTASGTGTPDGKEKEDDKKPLPGAYPRTIAPSERVVPSLSRPGSRIPRLAKDVLPTPVYARTVRVPHPPVLTRGTQKLTYGPGVNAPWNSSLSPTPAPAPAQGKGKDAAPNGVASGKEEEKEGAKLPDARLYATWNYETKRFDEPLPARRRVGSIVVHPGAVSMGRARSESTNA